jgi:predicted dehydrogenase
VLGSIDLSWSLNKELDSYIDIYGSSGTIRVGWKESKYRLLSSADWIVFGRGYDKVQAFRRQVENFCRAVQREERLLISPDDALASVQVIEAAYQSTRRDDWVAVLDAGAYPSAQEQAAARA